MSQIWPGMGPDLAREVLSSKQRPTFPTTDIICDGRDAAESQGEGGEFKLLINS